MTLEQIKASGLLELYVLGEISDDDRQTVEQAMKQYPELTIEVNEISQAIEVYARSAAITPSADLKDKIIKSIKNNTSSYTTPTTNNGLGGIPGKGWLLALFGLFTALFAYSIYQQNMLKQVRQESQLAELRCDSLVNQQAEELEILRAIQNPDNQMYAFSATENFNNTKLSLFSNSASSKNYLKINQLPPITADQAYQLWSLKEGVDPIPLTVFRSEDGFIIPVDFEEGTATYAITIEPRGGSVSPTLTNLIATVAVS